MKSIDQLKQFYDSNLLNDLQVLENERKKIAIKALILNISCGISLGVSIILFTIISFFAFIPLFIDIFIWTIIYRKITKSYVSDFKISVIGRIIKFIDENLNYYPANCISEGTYMDSKLFRKSPDRYRGDDLISGKIDKTALMFSEIHSEYKTETRTKNGTQTQWHTIFKGLFFIADFNKKFKGETYVLPDLAQKMFGNLVGNLFQSWNKGRGELIKMEDVDFEKHFVVYGSDQIEARYILSTSLMKRILDYKQQKNKNIYISFIGNKIYTAIDYNKNLFEPKIFKTLLDFNIIKEYYEDLLLAADLVEELNLNTRIWN